MDSGGRTFVREVPVIVRLGVLPSAPSPEMSERSPPPLTRVVVEPSVKTPAAKSAVIMETPQHRSVAFALPNDDDDAQKLFGPRHSASSPAMARSDVTTRSAPRDPTSLHAAAEVEVFRHAAGQAQVDVPWPQNDNNNRDSGGQSYTGGKDPSQRNVASERYSPHVTSSPSAGRTAIRDLGSQTAWGLAASSPAAIAAAWSSPQPRPDATLRIFPSGSKSTPSEWKSPQATEPTASHRRSSMGASGRSGSAGRTPPSTSPLAFLRGGASSHRSRSEQRLRHSTSTHRNPYDPQIYDGRQLHLSEELDDSLLLLANRRMAILAERHKQHRVSFCRAEGEERGKVEGRWSARLGELRTAYKYATAAMYSAACVREKQRAGLIKAYMDDPTALKEWAAAFDALLAQESWQRASVEAGFVFSLREVFTLYKCVMDAFDRTATLMQEVESRAVLREVFLAGQENVLSSMDADLRLQSARRDRVRAEQQSFEDDEQVIRHELQRLEIDSFHRIWGPFQAGLNDLRESEHRMLEFHAQLVQKRWRDTVLQETEGRESTATAERRARVVMLKWEEDRFSMLSSASRQASLVLVEETFHRSNVAELENSAWAMMRRWMDLIISFGAGPIGDASGGGEGASPSVAADAHHHGGGAGEVNVRRANSLRATSPYMTAADNQSFSAARQRRVLSPDVRAQLRRQQFLAQSAHNAARRAAQDSPDELGGVGQYRTSPPMQTALPSGHSVLSPAAVDVVTASPQPIWHGPSSAEFAAVADHSAHSGGATTTKTAHSPPRHWIPAGLSPPRPVRDVPSDRSPPRARSTSVSSSHSRHRDATAPATGPAGRAASSSRSPTLSAMSPDDDSAREKSTATTAPPRDTTTEEDDLRVIDRHVRSRKNELVGSVGSGATRSRGALPATDVSDVATTPPVGDRLWFRPESAGASAANQSHSTPSAWTAQRPGAAHQLDRSSSFQSATGSHNRSVDGTHDSRARPLRTTGGGKDRARSNSKGGSASPQLSEAAIVALVGRLNSTATAASVGKRRAQSAAAARATSRGHVTSRDDSSATARLQPLVPPSAVADASDVVLRGADSVLTFSDLEVEEWSARRQVVQTCDDRTMDLIVAFRQLRYHQQAAGGRTLSSNLGGRIRGPATSEALNRPSTDAAAVAARSRTRNNTAGTSTRIVLSTAATELITLQPPIAVRRGDDAARPPPPPLPRQRTGRDGPTALQQQQRLSAWERKTLAMYEQALHNKRPPNTRIVT